MRMILVPLIAALSFACSSTDRWLRPPTMTQPVISDDDLVTTKCARGTADDCIYFTVQVDAPPTAERTPEERDQVIDYLRFIADRNCENFISRAFANRSGLEASRNVSKDLATGLAAGTAYALPAASVGFGFANLFSGTVTDNINATYYVKETFPALKSAIATVRERQLETIVKKRRDKDGKPTTLSQYPFWEAVADVDQYAHLCSFDAAVSELTSHAATDQKQATNSRLTAENKSFTQQQ